MTCFPRDILGIFALHVRSHSIGCSGAATAGPRKDWEQSEDTLLVDIDVTTMNGLMCLVVAAENGSLWIGSENGLHRVERGNKKADWILPEPRDRGELAVYVLVAQSIGVIPSGSAPPMGCTRSTRRRKPSDRKSILSSKELLVQSLAVSKDTLAIGTDEALYLWDQEDPKKASDPSGRARGASLPGDGPGKPNLGRLHKGNLLLRTGFTVEVDHAKINAQKAELALQSRSPRRQWTVGPGPQQ